MHCLKLHCQNTILSWGDKEGHHGGCDEKGQELWICWVQDPAPAGDALGSSRGSMNKTLFLWMFLLQNQRNRLWPYIPSAELLAQEPQLCWTSCHFGVVSSFSNPVIQHGTNYPRLGKSSDFPANLQLPAVTSFQTGTAGCLFPLFPEYACEDMETRRAAPVWGWWPNPGTPEHTQDSRDHCSDVVLPTCRAHTSRWPITSPAQTPPNLRSRYVCTSCHPTNS